MLKNPREFLERNSGEGWEGSMATIAQAAKHLFMQESPFEDSPQDTVLFRKEDHQLLQPMYAFKIKVDPNVPRAIPELTHVITMDEMKIPIANKGHLPTLWLDGIRAN
jgi:hypothetical protein